MTPRSWQDVPVLRQCQLWSVSATVTWGEAVQEAHRSKSDICCSLLADTRYCSKSFCWITSCPLLHAHVHACAICVHYMSVHNFLRSLFILIATKYVLIILLLSETYIHSPLCKIWITTNWSIQSEHCLYFPVISTKSHQKTSWETSRKLLQGCEIICCCIFMCNLYFHFLSV